MARATSVAILFAPLSVYYLRDASQLIALPKSLDLGIIAVPAVLSGLVLSAGSNLKGGNKEAIQVVQKFILVIVLITIFLPTIYAVEIMGGIRIWSFEFTQAGWSRGSMFLIASLAFYGSIIFFIIALVDLVFAVFGISLSKTADASIESPPS